MAISRKPLDVDNYSALDGGTGLAVPGYYRRTNLNDVINNFIIYRLIICSYNMKTRSQLTNNELTALPSYFSLKRGGGDLGTFRNISNNLKLSAP